MMIQLDPLATEEQELNLIADIGAVLLNPRLRA